MQIVLLMLCILVYSGLNIIWPYLNGVVLYEKVLAKNDSFLASFGIPGGKYVLALGILVLTM
ncbi:MAG: hypothetical protein J6S78_07535, partial [Lachnospiraceae bacterium]|nr:hypothetical protein [Lachnospiraceae bacterium]